MRLRKQGFNIYPCEINLNKACDFKVIGLYLLFLLKKAKKYAIIMQSGFSLTVCNGDLLSAERNKE